MKNPFRRPYIQVPLLIAAVGAIVAGIMRDDVREVITNATLLCFSCIGIK
jgi:hypothetical protein